MDLTLNYATESNQIKSENSAGQVSLVLGYNEKPYDLHLISDNTITVKIGNAEGYIQDIQIDTSKISDVDKDNGKFYISLSDKHIQNLPPDVYYLEAWLNVPQNSDQGNLNQNNNPSGSEQLIFPSNTVLPFTIDANIVNGSNSMPMITFNAIQQDWNNFKQLVLKHETETEVIIDNFNSQASGIAGQVSSEINQYYSFASGANSSMNDIDGKINSIINVIDGAANGVYQKVDNNVNSGKNQFDNMTSNLNSTANSTTSNATSAINDINNDIQSAKININQTLNSADNNMSSFADNIDSRTSSADSIINDDIQNASYSDSSFANDVNNEIGTINNDMSSFNNNLSNQDSQVSDNIFNEAKSASVETSNNGSSAYNLIGVSASSVYTGIDNSANSIYAKIYDSASSAYGGLDNYIADKGLAIKNAIGSNINENNTSEFNKLNSSISSLWNVNNMNQNIVNNCISNTNDITSEINNIKQNN